MIYQVYCWTQYQKLSPKQIKSKVKEKYGEDVPDGTLCGFYKGNLHEYFNKTAEDRLKVKDFRINPKQRPDIVLDMEGILARRCIAVARTGIPYVARIARLLGLHIFHQLVQTNVYDIKGQRKQQDKALQVEMTLTVEHATLIRKYLTKSTGKTEFHKSTNPERNTIRAR